MPASTSSTPSSAPRELTLDEAVALAVQLQQAGELPAAHEVFRRVLGQAPDHPRALHYAGVLAHQQGRSADAVTLITRSLALAPEEADWHSNAGIVLQACGQLDAAIDAYQRAIGLDEGHANAHSNLGVVLRAVGRPAEAEAAYRAAIRLHPGHLDAHTNLGILLGGLGRTQEAAACYCTVITLRPQHREARKLLALAHCMLGDTGAAERVLDEWRADEPDNPVPQHLLAACTGRDVPARASDGFIERTFDGFAASFDAKLAALGYRAPALVAAMVGDAVAPVRQLDVLDAGCGTGLCGTFLAPYARRLVGVDLSAGMLAQAADKQCYDALEQGELTQYLREHPLAFDLIVSADTLVYFGELTGVIMAAGAALRPGGTFVFTVEHAADDGIRGGYRLEVHGRYSHTRAYVDHVVAAARLRVEVVPAELRMENGVPVAGLVVRATREPA